MSKWGIAKMRGYEKDVEIVGPITTILSVDIDDVDFDTVVHELRKIFQILDDHWDDPEYKYRLNRRLTDTILKEITL